MAIRDLSVEDQIVLDKIEKVEWLWRSYSPINLDMLDMVFCARRYFTYKDRQRSRVECCLAMYENGFSQSSVSLFEKDDMYEPIDSAMFYSGNYEGLMDFYKNVLKKGD